MRKTANLAARKDNLRNLEETFTYDHLNRLTDVWLNNVHTGHMAYDALGRMTDKRTDGQNVFSSAQHDYVGPDGQLRPHAISSATVEDNPFPTTQQSITYTMFDKVKTITQDDCMLSYEYGYDHQRIKMEETLNGTTVTEKDYFGNCEIIHKNGNIPYTYLSGPLGTFAVVRRIRDFDQISFIYKDHLGSWTTLSDYYGGIEQELSFDAWGNLRNPDTWTNYTAPELAEGPMLDRGFTGHEHLYNFGLINMNGRMYDPIMSSFLSVDNYVQAPDFSQSFNRYAYCLNNPLKYTDPSGESILAVSMIVGAAVCAYIGGTAANGWNYNPCSWAWDGKTWAGIGIGAVVGAGAGAAFAYAAPCLASTAFMSHFGANGAVASYTMAGFATLGTGGYAAGFAGGMLYSNGDTRYSHLSGVQGFKVGATVGALAGQLAGDIVNYKPPQEVNISIQPESKWKGNYYQGSENEATQLLLESSKFFKVETAMWYTSRGYYFEPISGDMSYTYKTQTICCDEYGSLFKELVDYNIPNGPRTNTINSTNLFSRLGFVDGDLYLYPSDAPVSKIYYHAHTHPHNSEPGPADNLFSYLFGIRCRVYGWNGCVYYYGGPGYWR